MSLEKYLQKYSLNLKKIQIGDDVVKDNVVKFRYEENGQDILLEPDEDAFILTEGPYKIKFDASFIPNFKPLLRIEVLNHPNINLKHKINQYYKNKKKTKDLFELKILNKQIFKNREIFPSKTLPKRLPKRYFLIDFFNFLIRIQDIQKFTQLPEMIDTTKNLYIAVASNFERYNSFFDIDKLTESTNIILFDSSFPCSLVWPYYTTDPVIKGHNITTIEHKVYMINSSIPIVYPKNPTKCIESNTVSKGKTNIPFRECDDEIDYKIREGIWKESKSDLEFNLDLTGCYTCLNEDYEGLIELIDDLNEEEESVLDELIIKEELVEEQQLDDEYEYLEEVKSFKNEIFSNFPNVLYYLMYTTANNNKKVYFDNYYFNYNNRYITNKNLIFLCYINNIFINLYELLDSHKLLNIQIGYNSLIFATLEEFLKEGCTITKTRRRQVPYIYNLGKKPIL